MQLSTPLSAALRTTQPHLKALQEAGFTTVKDLLAYYPRTHTDLSDMRDVCDVVPNELNTVAGEIVQLRTVRTRHGRVLITAKLIGKEESVIDLTWFHQTWVTRVLGSGDEIVVTGKVTQTPRGHHKMIVNQFEKVSQEMLHAGRMVPVYRQHGKLINTKWLREKLYPLLPLADKLPDLLPAEIVERQDLPPLGASVQAIHFPSSEEDKEHARSRLAFDELFFLQLGALQRKLDWQRGAAGSGTVIPTDKQLIAEFTSTLPFQFTQAQKVSTYEILADMAKDTPMNRLLEGDVGSGKTVVAALAIYLAIKSGGQAALLAPTEILAAQHFKNFLQVLHPLGIRAELLTGSTPAKAKKEISAKLKTGQLDLVVGTHALLQEHVQFQSLALAVIDEQHRFGVEQRTLLKKDGTPHVLSMTATPIPRTLALTIFGDQDVSIIDELPPGRTPIITRVVPKKKRADSYHWIESEVAKGRQVFIVCPLVEESETLEVKSAKAEYKRLSEEIFPKLTVGLLHGKLKPREKDAVMSDFSSGKTQVLVATTVIEVGIDVPNASIMLIEAADRFGLAQLHQLRGRVGRGEHQSYCFLFSESDEPEASERLAAMVEHTDGFKLAEIDLQLRGPGEVFGTRQSGIPDLKLARLTDYDLIKRSRDEAEKLLDTDPELKNHLAISQKLAELAADREE